MPGAASEAWKRAHADIVCTAAIFLFIPPHSAAFPFFSPFEVGNVI